MSGLPDGAGPDLHEDAPPHGESSSSVAGGQKTDFFELTPRQVVTELDRYIIGQDDAKRAVAIALRNRWRRRKVTEDLREEILPNNIIMIGPTGVGKTEIARRLARLAGAPFVKVEASKFTEVGYVGRDVESMVRDLVEFAVNLVRTEREEDCREIAAGRVEERLLDLLLPPVAGESSPADAAPGTPRTFVVGSEGARMLDDAPGEDTPDARRRRTREKLRGLLRDGRLGLVADTQRSELCRETCSALPPYQAKDFAKLTGCPHLALNKNEEAESIIGEAAQLAPVDPVGAQGSVSQVNLAEHGAHADHDGRFRLRRSDRTVAVTGVA